MKMAEHLLSTAVNEQFDQGPHCSPLRPTILDKNLLKAEIRNG